MLLCSPYCVLLVPDDDDEEYDSSEDDALPHDLDAEAFGSIDSLQAEVLCTQLAKVVDLMRTSRRRSSMIPAQGGSSFLDMVNLVDIDDQSKKWLSSQFTSETNGTPRPGSVGKALQPVVEGAVEAEDGENSEAAALGWRVDGDGSLIGAVEGELDVYYVDSEGQTQGPFTLLQLRSWEQDGYLESELQVRVGDSGDYAPLATLKAELSARLLGVLIESAAVAKDKSDGDNVRLLAPWCTALGLHACLTRGCTGVVGGTCSHTCGSSTSSHMTPMRRRCWATWHTCWVRWDVRRHTMCQQACSWTWRRPCARR